MYLGKEWFARKFIPKTARAGKSGRAWNKWLKRTARFCLDEKQQTSFAKDDENLEIGKNEKERLPSGKVLKANWNPDNRQVKVNSNPSDNQNSNLGCRSSGVL